MPVRVHISDFWLKLAGWSQLAKHENVYEQIGKV